MAQGQRSTNMHASSTDAATGRYFQSQQRRLSLDDSADRAQSALASIPLPIQLCFYPNEKHAYHTMKVLFSSRFRSPSNVSDRFGCNILMYALRCQRYHLFNLLLNDIALDVNLRSQDQQGNNVLHYAVVYDKDGTKLVEKVLEIFQRFGMGVDERNEYGLTPLLLGNHGQRSFARQRALSVRLAIFCGRYDVALTLLKNADASPFARDHIHLRNVLDYATLDEQRTCRPSEHESVRLRLLLHQIFAARAATATPLNEQSLKSFFEHFLPSAMHDKSDASRASVIAWFHTSHSPSNLTELIRYVHERYPQMKSLRRRLEADGTSRMIRYCASSKANLHDIIRLFDPDLRPKATLPKEPGRHRAMSHGKTPTTFKRVGTRVAAVVTLPLPQGRARTDSLTTK